MEILFKTFHWSMSQGFPCMFHAMTGLYCPGCGGTRAVRALLRGDVLMSFQYHPLVPYMAAVLLLQLGGWLLFRATKNPGWLPGHLMRFVYIGIGIILANWIFKNYMLVVRGVDLLPLWPYWEA